MIIVVIKLTPRASESVFSNYAKKSIKNFMVPFQTPDRWWFLFFSGAIAICAMILPGISSAFILLFLGKYDYVINAVSERNIGVLIIVALGCAVGICLSLWLARFDQGENF